MPFSFSYILLIVVMLALGLGSQAAIKMTYKRWQKVGVAMGLSGAQVARQMLNSHGLTNVSVQCVAGELTDHFDPRTGVVSLSKTVYNSTSVSAVAVACHECGHALQYAEGFLPMRARSAILPVVNFCSNAWVFVLLVGIFLGMLNLVWAAIILYAAVIVFQLITLPVEFNASHRGLDYIKSSFPLMAGEYKGARSVLTAAAMTYVAAALSSLLYLFYMLGFARQN
ncbi:MAG: zinc metallopeptidase [Coriobacteriales bacterium]|jgi:Zn-dependent membrane protease YugP|nr:zinc metallopeptidase [Coriobacteriales bacterium]